MCSVARAIGVVFAATAALSPASGQDVRTYEQRVDSFATVYRAAVRAREAYEAGLGRDYRQFDTISAGPLRVLAPRHRHGLAQAGADSAVASLARYYGRALDVLARHPLVLRDEAANEGGRDRIYVLIAEIGANRGELSPQVLAPQADIVTNVLVRKMVQILVRDADPAFTSWLGNATLPTDTALASAWPQARIDLLSSYATVARNCYDADLAACRLALALTPTRDPAMEWLNARARRAVVENLEGMYWARIDHTAAKACLAGSDSVCAAVLRSRPAFLSDPLASYHRVELLQLAMAVGGAGAMDRALSTPGGADQRIAAAARVPTDSVVRMWVARVRDVPKPTENMSPMIAASSMGWILFCGALAYRSSRWR